MTLRERMARAAESIRTATSFQPVIGIILGTGLGRLADAITKDAVIEYDDIPDFPVSTVESHHGRLILGTLGRKRVVAMQGRFHYYEGYTMQQITFPVRVMHELGARTLVVSNAPEIEPALSRGDLMLIEDHINLIGDNPLIGRNDDTLGPRFPDMSEPYSHELMDRAEEAAMQSKIKVHRGTFVAVAGPNLETRAEYRFSAQSAPTPVAMSTVPEVIVARHMNMRVLGMSIITDECFPDNLAVADIADIIAAANAAEPKMTRILEDVVEGL